LWTDSRAGNLASKGCDVAIQHIEFNKVCCKPRNNDIVACASAERLFQQEKVIQDHGHGLTGRSRRVGGKVAGGDVEEAAAADN
jgi:hypothetical protein